MIINRTCGGGNSFQINGDIARGSVKSGNTISEGDFVSCTVGSWGADSRASYKAYADTPIELSDGRLLIFSRTVATFMTINGNTFTATDVDSPIKDTNTYLNYKLACVPLSEDRILVAHYKYYSSDGKVDNFVSIYKVNTNNSFTLLGEVMLDWLSYASYGFIGCKLSDNKVVFFETYETSPAVIICTINDGNSVSVHNAGTIKLHTNTNAYYLGSAIMLDENTMMLSSDYGTTGYVYILKVNDTSLTLSNKTAIYTGSDSDDSGNPPKLLKLEDGKVFVIMTITHDGGGDASNYGIMVYYDKNYNITHGSAVYFGNGNIRIPIRLSKYRIGAASGTWRWTTTAFTFISVDKSDNITLTSQITLNDDDYSGSSNIAMCTSKGAIVLLHEEGEESPNCIIKSADTYSKYSSGTIAGVARIDAGSGGAIEVYTP